MTGTETETEIEYTVLKALTLDAWSVYQTNADGEITSNLAVGTWTNEAAATEVAKLLNASVQYEV